MSIEASNHDGVEDTWDFIKINGKTVIDIFHPVSAAREEAKIRISSNLKDMTVSEAGIFHIGLRMAINKARTLNDKFKEATGETKIDS